MMEITVKPVSRPTWIKYLYKNDNNFAWSKKRHQSSGISSKAEPGSSDVLSNLCVVRVPQEDLSSRGSFDKSNSKEASIHTVHYTPT